MHTGPPSTTWVWPRVVFANLDVFGRDPNSDDGRSHYGSFVSGMMVEPPAGGVVGGWALEGKATATGISQKREHPKMDIPADETLPAYFRTIMDAAGVSRRQSEAAHGNPRVS